MSEAIRLYRVEYDLVEIHHFETIGEAVEDARKALYQGHAVKIIPVWTKAAKEQRRGKQTRGETSEA